MLPGLSVDNLIDAGSGNAVHGADVSCRAAAVSPLTAYSNDEGLGKACLVTSLAARREPTVHSISHIVGLSPRYGMKNAPLYIAAMTDNLSVGDSAAANNVADTMGETRLVYGAGVGYVAIAMCARRPIPEPASVGLLNKRPEVGIGIEVVCGPAHTRNYSTVSQLSGIVK